MRAVLLAPLLLGTLLGCRGPDERTGDAGQDDAGRADGGWGDGGAEGEPCTWAADHNPCGEGQFCAAPGCAQGRCSPRGSSEEGAAKDPRCGCDGHTYWSADTARRLGMSEKHPGECEAPTSCGGFTGAACPKGMKCRYQVSDEASCGSADHSGVCWFLPETCARASGAPGARMCGATSCTDECSASSAEMSWHLDPGC